MTPSQYIVICLKDFTQEDPSTYVQTTRKRFTYEEAIEYASQIPDSRDAHIVPVNYVRVDKKKYPILS